MPCSSVDVINESPLPCCSCRSHECVARVHNSHMEVTDERSPHRTPRPARAELTPASAEQM